jgi:16S rRNA (guanine966-N2)-methyltransferase
MRIIAGTVGGRRLKAPRGVATRPTADKVRQAIFNILEARGAVPERALDLYAGTGALGLEALSRGAREAVFVESHAATAALIRDNARELGFVPTAARVETARVLDWLARARAATGQEEKSTNVRAFLFGWIFVDPPYASSDSGELARALDAAAPLLDEGGALVVEHDARAEPAAPVGLSLASRRRYGQTAVTFYTREAP